ncbi:ArsR/SmtB family transcription factor [Saccharopolyspora spinosa]|uniref:DNA-binding transcriptional ArsR family regulator n=1 Tax=Saccharopolyspora spinosa TaxID=60894 RepID=A0A2N3Y4M8_SACSN|nr:DNA-binding transcriptional ArsR family regulator [Saccharopolyspora spinosa]
MHAFDVLGDPVRRRILDLLADGELAAGQISTVVQEEFGISQPGVSQHLRVLRENGFATVRAEGTRRLYAVDATPLKDVDMWLERYRGFWNERLDTLGTELTQGARQRRMQQERETEAAAEAADDGGDQSSRKPGKSGVSGDAEPRRRTPSRRPGRTESRKPR